MMQFQPLTGPGFRVTKKAVTAEQLRAEIQKRLAGSAIKATLPPIVPADRGRNSANWTVDLTGVPLAVQPVIVAAMREFDVEEPAS